MIMTSESLLEVFNNNKYFYFLYVYFTFDWKLNRVPKAEIL